MFSDLVSELGTKPGASTLLERKLVLLENQKFELEGAEVLLVLRQVGAGLGPEQVELLVQRFRSDRPGFMDTKAFRQALRAATAQ